MVKKPNRLRLNDIPVTCRVIDEKQRDEYIDMGYNRPPDDDPTDELVDEWNLIFNDVKNSVSKHWRFGIDDDDDFFMDQNWEPDRLMCIEVSNRKMPGVAILKTVHDAILRHEESYSVDICDAWGVLEAGDGERHPHFNIFVEKEQILFYSESDEVLKKFGLLIAPDE